MKSDVYFVPVESNDLKARCQALEKLLESIQPLIKYQKDELVPVKITIGDSASVFHVHPEFAKRVVAEVKLQKAKPFLFDTSVIYHGLRQNAVDHLTLAQNKSFSQVKIGAPFIIADGLLGQDGREFQIDAPHIKKIRVPSFIGMLNSLLVLSHATGHMVSGFAGAIKNVAMGMSCRSTKQVQHSSLKPSIIQEKCTACGCCIRMCPVQAIRFNKKGKAQIDPLVCIGCGECLCACKFDAVYVNWAEEAEIFGSRMIEVAQFILSQFKNKFFITFAFDITQECDCISTKDDRMVSQPAGIFASTDVLSIDRAVCDRLSDEFNFFKEHEVYKKMLTYGDKLGLGSLDYRLVKI